MILRAHSVIQNPMNASSSSLNISHKIQILPPILSERIAAGEVIERPASVVKELVENSLDAGATEIQVRLEEGGKNLIEVLDNGCGISSEDLPYAIQRHATSKLKSLEDLERITTLGFRGEALPSIASVSELTLLSRTQTEPASSPAYELQVGETWQHRDSLSDLKVEAISFGSFIDRHHGTLIQSRGLFAQVPARLKFLKAQGAEVTQTKEWMERLALCHPFVGFQLFSQDKKILDLRPCPSDNRLGRILELLGGEKLSHSISLQSLSYPENIPSASHNHHQDAGIFIQAHWIKGLSVRSTQKLIQMVNHRAIKDRLLQQAILSAFRQSLLPGQFPALVLEMEIQPAAIDVNVHPTKTEIRFLEPQRIYHLVESLIKKLIHQGSLASLPFSGASEAPPLASFFQTAPFSSTSTSLSSHPPRSFDPLPQSQRSHPPEFRATRSSSPSSPHQQTALPSSSPTHHSTLPPLLSDARYWGALFLTYLVYEKNSELVLIDQHAAHERLRYEALKRQFLASSPHSQALLMPETVRFENEQGPLLKKRLPWLERLGFEVEFFGEMQLLFRAIPFAWESTDLSLRLLNLIDRLLSIPVESSSYSPEDLLLDESVFEKIASEACHSSVRSKDKLSPSEAQHLVEALFQTEHPWNCPHGRPTLIQLSRNKIEEWFLRKAP